MKKISDYFGTKTAIKCENEQQWEKLKELCGDRLETNYKFSIKYPFFSLGFIGYRFDNTTYTILPYSDFVSDVPELVGVEMEVSNDGATWWCKRLVYGRCELGFIAKVEDDNSIFLWKHARPIQPKKVLTATLQELAEMLNVDEIQLK